ncbi:MAG: NAD(P)H-dependent oxidoreductase [Opitutales bacterium]
MSTSVLICFAHPAFERSRANRALLEAVRVVDGVRVHDLYEAYPDFVIDVPAEQARMEAHEAIVFQFPFFWYSTPAILKEWQDLVLEHGWAYGSDATALRGKRFLCALTTGGGVGSYGPSGGNRYSVPELLRPLEQTARLCGMEPLEPFIVYETHSLSDAQLAAEAQRYAARLQALTTPVAGR